MLQFLQSLYFSARFFYVLALVILLFLASYWFPAIYPLVWLLVLFLGVAALSDMVMLYQSKTLSATRILPEKFSNSDTNTVLLQVENKASFPTTVQCIDELPVQFQKRDFFVQTTLSAKAKKTIPYDVRPVERGEYVFGKLNCYVLSGIGLVKRRYAFDKHQLVKVYPSFVQMKKYDFLSIDSRATTIGLKKVRRIGHTMEFEQIKEYVSGDDIRTVNWKATAKHARLMVNQYQDEKMQPIYSIIDTSRVMKMPFNGLKLLDYAINSSLAFSNIALKKGDKIGLVDFSNTIGNFLPANAKKTYLNVVLETLYNTKTDFLDADYGLLQVFLKKRIPHRSLLLLYTNFEHISALRRQLPYLQAIAKRHVLVVLFFENSKLTEVSLKKAETVQEIANNTIAQQFIYEKKLMIRELQKRGVQTVLTTPEDLTVNTINKYLEIKARGLL